MSWRDRIARLREAEDAACNRANYANPWPVVGPVSHDSHDCRGSAPDSGRSGTAAVSHDSHDCTKQAADPDIIDLMLEAADLIRLSGVEGLSVGDLDEDTVFNLTWFAKLGTAARSGLRVWFQALAAAKRSESGLGVASAPSGQHEHLVAVARRGSWSRLLMIEQKVDSLALVEGLMKLVEEHGRKVALPED